MIFHMEHSFPEHIPFFEVNSTVFIQMSRLNADKALSLMVATS